MKGTSILRGMFFILSFPSFKKSVHLKKYRVHVLEALVASIPSNSKMMNTRKENYQTHSSKAIDEAPNSQTNMHGVQMRGRLFKSTPTQIPY